MKVCLHFSCTYTIILKNQVVWTMSGLMGLVEWSSGVVKWSSGVVEWSSGVVKWSSWVVEWSSGEVG